MSTTLFTSQIDPTGLNTAEQIFNGDDLIVCLDPVLGSAVSTDPNLSVKIFLFDGNVKLTTTEVTIADGDNGTNFVDGHVVGVIQDTILTTLPLATYSLGLIVEQGTLKRTYRLRANYTLITI